VSNSTTHTQATALETIGADENKALGPEPVDKQRIVPGGLPIFDAVEVATIGVLVVMWS